MEEVVTLLDCIFATVWDDFADYAWAEEEFKRQSVEDRFTYFYNILKHKESLPDLKTVLTKSTSKSIEYRKLADQDFCNKRYILAVKWYTRSAAVAFPDSAELATAFANRSATLYQLESFTPALCDLNRALQGNYPKQLKPKLQDRKFKYITRLQSPDQTLPSYVSTMENLPVTFDPARLISTSSPPQYEFDIDITDMNYELRFALPPVNYPKPTEIPFTNKKVKIKYNPKFGRHIVAKEEIKPGEPLGMERPVASTLDLRVKYSHCCNCYVRSESLIPCNTCALVMYCSEKCMQAAYDEYHRVECAILFNAQHFEIKDDIWLAVRMLMIVTKQGVELESLMNHPIYGNPMKIDPTYIPSKFGRKDYLNIHHLEDNAAKSSFEENYTLGFTAALLLHILKHSEFFGKKKVGIVSTDLSSKESYTGELLLKFLFVIKHNAFRIKETIRDDADKFELVQTVKIGSSIYVFHSYFNHSCDENGTKCFHKDAVVSRSVQPVTKGEQIFLNYGVDYGKVPHSVRQLYLYKDFKFHCDCHACGLGWPVLTNHDAATVPKLKPNSIKLQSLNASINKIIQIRQTPVMAINRAFYESLRHHIEMYHKNVKKPWRVYYECQELLKDIYTTEANHYYKAIDGFVVHL